MITRLAPSDLDTALSKSSRLLIATDFDGTLCRIARRPDLVYVPEEIRAVLRSLANLNSVATAVVSGRSIADVEQRVGLPLLYAGNHGFEISGPGFRFEHPAALESAGLLEQVCVALEESISRWHGAWVERKRLTATAHFRNVVADEQHRVAMAVRQIVSDYSSVFVLRAGKRALEVRPRVEWHKGAAVEYILREIGFEGASCICIGDDVTDEAMFRAFPDALTVRVGWHSASAARFYVDEPCDVRRMLEQVVDFWSNTREFEQCQALPRAAQG